MKDLHKRLSEKFSWYASWHEMPEHKVVHYSVLAIAVAFAVVNIWVITKTNPAQSAVSVNNKSSQFADLNFSNRMKGKKELIGTEAVEALGVDIDRVANAYGMTGQDLKKNFERTKTLRISKDALLFYADEILNASVGDGTIPNNPTVSDIPDADTFFLHSNPNSTNKIYLNFVGGTITTPYWNGGNPLTLEAYSQDADPAFNTAEQDAIQAIWRSVAEDYSPFTVDVTTEKPITYDAAHYTEIYITPSSSWYGSAGGVSYVGSYTWGLNIPGFVFSALLGNSTKNISEAASHEVGHTVGLYHAQRYDANCNYVYEYDPGSGSNPGWAPIMGNSYGKGVTQWINTRDWPYIASNSCNGEVNELTSMVSGGLVIRPDDAGSTTGTAGNLVHFTTNGQATIDHLGYITPGDVDMYKIDVSDGTLNLSVAPMAPLATNIIGDADMNVRVLNSSGNVVAESNPVAVATATISTPVTAGRYYVEISSSGYLDVSQPGGYTETGSVGQYNVTGTYQASTVADTTAPTVNMTSPTNGTTVSGTIAISATAMDEVGVSRVEFYRGGVFINSNTTAPFSIPFDTTTVANGSTSFSAKAYDAAGNIGNSSSVSVTVNNTVTDITAPVVTVTSPKNGTVITAKTSSVTVKGSATDNSGTISKIEVYINNTLKSSASSNSISYRWTTKGLAQGTYNITLKAYDAAGNIGQSSVSVTK